ncbi:MAG: FHA domain-containing protein [Leifsonia sp.]
MSGNPFLLPPGGAERARPAAVPDAAPTRARTSDPEHYIAVPASVESATHRIQRPEPPESRDPVEAEAAEEMRVAPAPSPVIRAWVLVLPDGTRLALTGPLVLGRNPASIPDRPEAELLAVVDPGKTVSKTHALLEPDSEGVRVRDLHSTNGVSVDAVAETVVGAPARRVLNAGGEAVAPVGSTILLGSFPIGVAAG